MTWLLCFALVMAFFAGVGFGGLMVNLLWLSQPPDREDHMMGATTTTDRGRW